MLATS